MPARMSVKIEPLDARETLRDVAYVRLRQLLILSQLTRGERLREPEWSMRLGVNRAALREAFARLEAEGLLVRGAKTGYLVPQLTDADIAEIVKVRLALEKTAVDEICGATGDLRTRLRPMREALQAFESLARRQYMLGTMEADRRFHEGLVNAAGLRLLTLLYQRAPLPMISRSIAGKDEWSASATATLDDHRAILLALEHRDAAEAKRVLESHLRRASILPLCP
jgi:DNA-binding GntR family transcriptional regulator